MAMLVAGKNVAENEKSDENAGVMQRDNLFFGGDFLADSLQEVGAGKLISDFFEGGDFAKLVGGSLAPADNLIKELNGLGVQRDSALFESIQELNRLIEEYKKKLCPPHTREEYVTMAYDPSTHDKFIQSVQESVAKIFSISSGWQNLLATKAQALTAPKFTSDEQEKDNADASSTPHSMRQ